MHTLPPEAQFAPVNAIITEDINNDGFKDVLLAGNEYNYDAMTGKADASYGCILINDHKAGFKPVNIVESGFILDGEIKDFKKVRTYKNQIIVAVANNDSLKVFKKNIQLRTVH